MIAILVVDDQKTAREILKAQLSSEPDMKIVGIASDGHTALEQVEILQPNIVLIDMEMPGLDGVSSTEEICRRFPQVKVIVLSMHDEDRYITRSLQAGAMGYLLKNTPTKELIEAIRFVNKGYSQIGPGLLNKLVAAMPHHPRENGKHPAGVATQNLSQLISLPKQSRPWWHYATWWLLGNLIIWGTSILYLQIVPARYTSTWKIALPGASSSTSINIPEIGQASSDRDSPYNSLVADPRENYRLLALSDDAIAPAATSLQISAKKFGQPKVEIVDNSTLMEFAIDGSSPEQARNKAIALHEALKSKLDRLRDEEASQPDANLAKALNNAREKLETARQQLTDYQTSSGLNSNLQLTELSNNIERLQLEKVQLAAGQQESQSQFEALLNRLGLSVTQAQEAIALESDRVFQQYLDNYSQLSTELVNLQGKFSAFHPAIIAKQEDREKASTALIARASDVLGRPVDFSSLSRLGLDNERQISQKAILLERLITLNSEREGLTGKITELERQIASLQGKLQNSFESGARVEKLRKNLQIAEAVYSSIWTELEINKSKASSIYPSISLLTSPDLPDEPSAPKPKLVIFGAVLASFFLTTALFSLRHRDRQMQRFLSLNHFNSNSQNNHHQLVANSVNLDAAPDQ
jgi:DNA-binding NarL/FixJ family response regulator/uncharacterized protein involved in exopolysaccharide biosynthesis